MNHLTTEIDSNSRESVIIKTTWDENNTTPRKSPSKSGPRMAIKNRFEENTVES